MVRAHPKLATVGIDHRQIDGAPVAVMLRSTRDPIVAIKKTLAAIAEAARGRECVLLLIGDAKRQALWQKFAAAHRLDLEILSAP